MERLMLNDELDTPGCANCAIKHLSAALGYIIKTPKSQRTPYQYNPLFTNAARALINLGEVSAGYRSHLDYAVGLLEHAELECAMWGRADLVEAYRNERVNLIAKRFTYVPEAMRAISAVLQDSGCMAWAHVEEAMRELPGLIIVPAPTPEELATAIAKIHNDYFADPKERTDEV